MNDRNRLRLMRLLAAGLATEEDAAKLTEAEALRAKTEFPQVREMASDVEAAGEHTYRFVISDERVNRYGDVVLQSGWRMGDFARNPVALWQHGMDAAQGNEPIGAWSDVSIQMGASPRLVGTLRYASDASPFAARLEKLTAGGYLRAVSPTFMASGARKPKDDDERARYGLGQYGVLIEQADLWEVSVVAVGAQPGALRMAAEKGVLTTDEAEDMGRRLPTEREILARLDAEAERYASARTDASSVEDRLARIEAALGTSSKDQGELLERLAARIDGALKRLHERQATAQAPAYMAQLDRLIGRIK